MGWDYYDDTPISEMVGKTFVSVTTNSDKDEMYFKTDDGVTYTFYHKQDCCESVSIEDICGDLSDLENSPIVRAEERTEDKPETDYGTGTFTFYEFATNKGSVTVRWLGESNGYYSESVSLRKGN